VESFKKLLVAVRTGDRAALRRLAVFLVVGVTALIILLSSLGGPETGAVAKSRTKVTQGALFVAVVGSVVRPGVYPVDSATRLFEVISAAGGFTKDADQGSVNLARLVTDGEQIIVSNSLGVVAKSSASKLLSLNSATVYDLEALPGVGPTLAGRIIDWKSANGNFSSVEDLLKVSGIGDNLFARIRTMVRP